MPYRWLDYSVEEKIRPRRYCLDRPTLGSTDYWQIMLMLTVVRGSMSIGVLRRKNWLIAICCLVDAAAEKTATYTILVG